MLVAKIELDSPPPLLLLHFHFLFLFLSLLLLSRRRGFRSTNNQTINSEIQERLRLVHVCRQNVQFASRRVAYKNNQFINSTIWPLTAAHWLAMACVRASV